MKADLLCSLSDSARNDLDFWRELLAPILALQTGVTAAMRQAAHTTGIPFKTIERRYYAAKRGGWEKAINRRLIGPAAYDTHSKKMISPQDRELLKTYAERYQRNSAAAIRAMRRDWRLGLIQSTTPIDTTTGYPIGWSPTNLSRHLPSRYELTVARQGRSAGATERRLVYTTRRDLWVGSHYLFDDIWHDHFVNVLDKRQAARPLEFHAIDLFSACKFAWGMRPRLDDGGRMDSLKEADMRFLLAYVLGSVGYSPRGTVLVVEHGTAAIRPDLEALLVEESSGLISVERSGMEGAAAAAHQYAGRSKGNFRFKAALESLGNLIHNEMAALPGQVGKDIDHRPEGTHGLLKHNDALLNALAYLPPERAEMLRWPLLSIAQFRAIADEIYARINSRTDHDLEGWDLQMVPEPRTGRMRRLSPAEVWTPGSRQLTRLRPQAIAQILLRDNATEITARRGMLELTDSDICLDPLRFDARHLTDREKYSVVINPYHPADAYAFNARGQFVAACPRIHAVSRADIEAVHRECGAAAKAERERLEPFRARHLQDARQKAADMRHNAALLNPDTQKPTRLPGTQDLEALTQSEETPTHHTTDTDEAGDLASRLADLI